MEILRFPGEKSEEIHEDSLEMESQPVSRTKILKIVSAVVLAGIVMTTAFVNCSNNFVSAGVDGGYTQQAYTVDINISAQPASSSVMIGKSYTLSVNATGASTLYYQWYKDGTALTTSSSGSSYTITSATASDMGTYCVIIWDSSGSVISANATVTVTTNPDSPAITTQPSAVVTSLGSSAQFSVVAVNGSPTYQWYLNGVAISGATSAAYNIASVASSDAGSYYVVVTNSVSAVTSSVVTLSIVAH